MKFNIDELPELFECEILIKTKLKKVFKNKNNIEDQIKADIKKKLKNYKVEIKIFNSIQGPCDLFQQKLFSSFDEKTLFDNI